MTRWFIWVPAVAMGAGLSLLALFGSGWLATAATAALLAGSALALIGVLRLRGHLAWLGKAGSAAGYVMIALHATSSALVQVLMGQTLLAWHTERGSGNSHGA